MTATVFVPGKPARPALRRSVLAVFAGLIVNVVLSTATDLVLVVAGVFPPLAGSDYLA